MKDIGRTYNHFCRRAVGKERHEALKKGQNCYNDEI